MVSSDIRKIPTSPKPTTTLKEYPVPYEDTHFINTEPAPAGRPAFLPTDGRPTPVDAFQVDSAWLSDLIKTTYLSEAELSQPDSCPVLFATDVYAGPGTTTWFVVDPDDDYADEEPFTGTLHVEDDRYTPVAVGLIVRDLVSRQLLPAGLPFLVQVRN